MKYFQNNVLRGKHHLISVLMLVQFAVAPLALADELDDHLDRLQQSANVEFTEWLELAAAARDAGRFALASSALDNAERGDTAGIRTILERARLQVAMNDPAAATAQLQIAVEQGFSGIKILEGDAVLMTLAGQPAFDNLRATMTQIAYPCEHQDGFDDFDFWVGEWDVRLADGTLAGQNIIQPIERNCVLVERWTSTTGGTGMSINYLDKATDEWVQIWNAEGGSQINIRGRLTDEGMRLSGRIHYLTNGTTADFRALWTPLPDGRVRQFFEQSNDDGDTWQPWFEGFYERRESASQ